ncbi:uncharacterized protein [Halyomorpha halys]|uniref:uncharacterized protein n=1 Tax=Halyomorpha halys TaxID=286706 RepID=UPI0006D50B1A|nr:uncharacterized protein LOC106690805 [Halyomorpha halys]XP_014291868.1 uncharacterized protein LOC106690805 [Halyomorpha halys]
MASDHSNRSFLNSIVLQYCSEDVNDAEVKRRADKVRSDLHKVETPFNWLKEGGDKVEFFFYHRAVSRNHQYTWEGYLNPFVQKILQAYYAMYRNDRLIVIKCLTMAEKCIRKGEQNGNFKILKYCVAIRHVFAATIASVFYRCNMFTRARQFLDPITPLRLMSTQSIAGMYFMKGMMLYYTGTEGYEEAMRWTTYGLKVDPNDTELRFLLLMLMYHLWNKEISPTLLDSATFHLKHHYQGVSLLKPPTFANFYNATSHIRNVPPALSKMESYLNQVTTETTTKEINSIELEIVMCLEVEPHYASLIGFAAHFFISTNQPEKAYFLQSIAKLLHFDNAYRWLDYKMLLYPETCDSDVFRSLLQYHHGQDAAKIYKRIAMHFVLYEPDKAFTFANKALAIENDLWLVTNNAKGTNEVPIYDEKILIFESMSGIGFYRFMVYYAHVLSNGEPARQFLWQIQEVLPSYLEATQFSQECQKMIDILLKNEFYRDPLKVPHRGSYQTAVIHCYD